MALHPILLLRLILATVGLVLFLAVPAAQAETAGGPEATASAGVKKKVTKLKRQVADLQREVEGLAKQQGPAGPQGPQGTQGTPGTQGPPGPSTGPAGGDLSGEYPNPLIAPDAVGADNVGLNALGGPDINESSLGQVPSSAAAANADTVDGHHAVCPTGTQLYIGSVLGDTEAVSGRDAPQRDE